MALKQHIDGANQNSTEAGVPNTSFGIIKDRTLQLKDGYLSKIPLFQFILLSVCFPMWGAAASLNDILITQFKALFTLSDVASAFVQSAFYGGYFVIAIPASRVIRKFSYKVGLLLGLSIYIVGCLLFFPASHVATYTVFSGGYFLGRGRTFLFGNICQHLLVDDWSQRNGDPTPQHFADLHPSWVLRWGATW